LRVAQISASEGDFLPSNRQPSGWS
jgi:hypothetical protein